MPFGLYGYGGPENDEQRSLLEMLLGGGDIPMPQAPQPPPQHSTGRNVIGSLGDALLSAASVRAGGGPQAIGPYTARQHQAERDYQTRLEQHAERVAEAEQANRVLKRQGIIALMQQQRDEDRQAREDRRLAETERHNRENEERMAGRARTRIIYSRTGKAFKEDIDTGQITEYNLPDGSEAGKQPSEKTVEEIVTLENLAQKSAALRHKLMQLFKDMPQAMRSGGRVMRGVEKFFTGAPDWTSSMSPQLENAASASDDLSDFLLRLRSGAQISEPEYLRLRALLPSIGESEESALDKLNRFDVELKSIMATRQRLQPAFMKPAAEADPATDLFREIFGRDPEP